MDFAEQFAAANLKTDFIAISPFISRDHRLICSQEEREGRGGGTPRTSKGCVESVLMSYRVHTQKMWQKIQLAFGEFTCSGLLNHLVEKSSLPLILFWQPL